LPSIAQLLLRLDKLTEGVPSVQLPSAIVNAAATVVEAISEEPGEDHTFERGLKTEYPVHAGLLQLSSRKNLDSASAVTISMILVATREWRDRLEIGATEKDASRKMFSLSEYDVWLALRKLPTAVLADISDSSFEALYRNIEGATAGECYGKGQRMDLRRVERFFARFLGIRERTANRASRDSVPKDEQHVTTLLESDPETDLEHPKVSIWEHHLCPKELRRTIAYSEGNSAAEIQNAGNYFREQTPISRTHGQTPEIAARRVRGQIAHIRRTAQMLPGRWGQLTDDEICQLLTTEAGYVFLAVPALRILSLMTGRPYDDVAKIRLVATEDNLPLTISPDDLYVVTNDRTWVTGVLAPEDRRKAHPEWEPVLQPHLDRLVLPITGYFWELLKVLVTRRSRGLSKRSVSLFDLGDDTVRILSGEISLSARNAPRRVTRTRIEQQLYSEILALDGDFVEASLITGRHPPGGTSAALFYHWCNREHLVAQYTKVLKRWERLVKREQTGIGQQQQLRLDGAVGSNLSLRMSAIQTLCSDFQSDVERWRTAWGDPELLTGFHNAFTNYTLFMVLFLTGYRVVTDVLDKRSDWDEEAGTLVIVDKTADDMGHVRMVPVCSTLRAQLRAYEQHSQLIRERLVCLGAEGSAGFLFYLSRSGDLERVTPRTIKARFAWGYGLHLNSNRHYLRGALRESGVSGNYVDALMGHWGIGREPTARYSGFDPLHYTKQVGAALEEIAEQIGFVVISGYGEK
jgi:hypothetical protein